MPNYYTKTKGNTLPAKKQFVGHLVLMLLISCTLLSCKKDFVPAGTASLTCVHTVVGANGLITNFNDKQPIAYHLANMISYASYSSRLNRLNSYAGVQHLALYQYPDTTSKDQPLFDLELDLPVNSISTLFLTGTVDAPDTLFTRDVVPTYAPADSTMGIRFVNLSPGSGPVSVNIKGKSNGSEVISLPYKNISGFKDYTLQLSPDEYEFEFRDVASGALIAVYSTSGSNGKPELSVIYNWLYHSFTLALVGLPGGTGNNAPQVFKIDHY